MAGIQIRTHSILTVVYRLMRFQHSMSVTQLDLAELYAARRTHRVPLANIKLQRASQILRPNWLQS